ncbi:hypothetical protein K1T71_014826 [Dendrolimus kikuchii]|nr:hypothetical protein K1T71_014826 [Dendrolimus kikuchii]
MATARVTRSKTGGTLASQAPPEVRAEHSEGLHRQISDSLAVVAGVAKVSKGLKGTLQKALKEAVASVQEASEELLNRTDSQEVALLRAANRRMEAELADLRCELASIRSELAEARAGPARPAPPPPPEPTQNETTAASLDHIVLLMENRFAALEDIRSELTMPRPDPPPQQTPPRVEPQAANLDRILLLIENRFAALEERVRPVQPALPPRPAFSTRPTPPPSAMRTPPTPTTLTGSPAREFPPLVPSPRRSTEAAAVVASTSVPLPCTSLAPPAAPAAEDGWSTVARRKPKKAAPAKSSQAGPAKPTGGDAQPGRGKKKKKRGGKGRRQQGTTTTTEPPPQPPPPPAKPQAEKKKARKAPRLRPPRSSAVVLTLLSGAGDRGVSYESLLATAKTKIRLVDLGIEGGVKIKTARTGARMLILPGADSAPKADALAERLRAALNAEDVRIARPERTVSLRVSGLDDYTTPKEVAAAIAQVAECPADQIGPNAIRTGLDGLGSTIVACQIAAAKKMEGTKLLVGWASAIVKLLPPRVPRCYRCHELHHVAAKCTSEVDRSGLCYRCGQTGHLVTGPCTAAPHCSVCEAAVVGGYCSPNRSLADFETWLVDAGRIAAQSRSLPVVMLGDFNAKSTAWGSPATDQRGEALEEWAIQSQLVVLNRGSVHKCVRMRGGSIVDLTLASPAIARRVANWRVLEGVKTLSDHRYIRFSVSPRNPDPRAEELPPTENYPRWVLKRLDREVFREALIVHTWESGPDSAELPGPNAEAESLRSLLTSLCDAAMPRAGPFRPARQAYWWNAEIARLRSACVRARNQYARYRRRRRRGENAAAVEARLYEGYSSARTAMKVAIKAAKSVAWEELLGTLDRDPWRAHTTLSGTNSGHGRLR